MKHYLAGPMSGIRQFNFPAFFNARDVLTRLGFDIILPADMEDPAAVKLAMASEDGKSGESLMTWGQCLAKDVELIADHVGGVIFLPGWQKSRGARLEAVTGLLCNREFRLYDPDTHAAPIVDATYINTQVYLSNLNPPTYKERKAS